MAPGKGKISAEFTNYLTAMKEIDSSAVKSRKDADSILKKFEPACPFLFTSFFSSHFDFDF